MTSIQERISEISSALPTHVTLVAVSKTKPASDIADAYEGGQRDFGENKIQEMADKYNELPKDIRWHMIGHVQTNKIKYMAPFVHLIHGCDREKVLNVVNKEAAKCNRVIDVLLQIHIAEEDSKFGFDKEEVMELAKSGRLNDLANIRVRGLMGMATFTENQDQIKREFKTLESIFEELKSQNLSDSFDTLSMGMSGDYKLAIECGSTMVRIGSTIFGARNYSN